jgi:4-amino-4-deoxy-L-arabinose transferase-like glycosyltransferase
MVLENTTYPEKPMKTTAQKPAQASSRIFFLTLNGSFTLAAFLFGLLDAGLLKSALDSLSPDGSLERLTVPLLQQLQPLALLFAAGSFAVLILFLLRKSLFASSLACIRTQVNALGSDTRIALQFIKNRFARRDLWLDVLFLLLLAGLARFVWLERPLEHDEAFTYYVFGRLPLRYALADYTYPNNHIFHTLLLKLSVGILGNASWAMRLPAFLFGSAAAPLLYGFARHSTRKRWTALLAGILAALYPYMIDYSVNARGYSLAAAFTILAAWLAWGTMQHKNRLLWLLFSLTLILGLYNLPVMLLPAGGLFTWLFLNGLLGNFSSAYRRWGWIKFLIISGILIILGTLLVYLPVFLYSGVESLLANPHVAPLNPSEFLPTLTDRLKDIWQEWQAGFPYWITLPAFALILLGIIRFDRKSRTPVSIYLSLVLFLVLYSILQKPNLWPRVIYYFTPFLMLALAFGLDGLAAALTNLRPHQPRLPAWLIPAAGALLLILSLLQAPNYSPLASRLKGETETIAQQLATLWQPDTLILIDYPQDMAFSVYMERLGLPPAAVRWESPFRGAYIILNKPEKQTLESVIRNRGPELAFFDLASAALLIDLPHNQVYFVNSHWNLVQQEYAKQSTP